MRTALLIAVLAFAATAEAQYYIPRYTYRPTYAQQKRYQANQYRITQQANANRFYHDQQMEVWAQQNPYAAQRRLMGEYRAAQPTYQIWRNYPTPGLYPSQLPY